MTANYVSPQVSPQTSAARLARILRQGEAVRDTDLNQLFFGDGSSTGGINQAVADRGGQVYNLKAYGCKLDGSTDDTAAVQALLTSLGNTAGGHLLIPQGTLRIDGSLTYTSNYNLRVSCDPGAVIDGRNSTATQLITVSGSIGSTQTAISANITAGDHTFTSTLNPNPGDILLITTQQYCDANDPGTYAGRLADGAWWNASRSGYYKGEMVEVESVTLGSPNTITIKGIFYDSYSSAKTKARTISAPQFLINNVKILRTGDATYRGLLLQYVRNAIIDGVSISGARDRLLQLSYVRGGTISNFTGTDFWWASTAASYGISIASCQDLRIVNSDIQGGRHSISHGGNEPYRDIFIIGNKLDNYHASGQASVDWHGNGELCIFAHNWVGNGIVCQCANMTISDNVLVTDNETAINYTPEINVGYVHVVDNKITVLNGTQNGIRIQNSQIGITYTDVNVSRNWINNASAGITITTSTILTGSLTISQLTMDDNQSLALNGYGLTVGAQAGSTLTISRGIVRGGKYSCANTSGGVLFATPLTLGTFIFDGVHFVASSAGAAFNGTLGNAIFNECRFEVGTNTNSTAAVISSTGDVKLINPVFVNSLVNGGLQLTASTYTIVGERRSSTAGVFSLTGTSIRHLDNQDGTDTISPLQWSSTSINLLTTDLASNEVSGTQWLAFTNVTTAQTSLAAWQGRFSLKMTSNASGNIAVVTNSAGAQGNAPSAVAGTQYTFSAHFLAATTGRTCVPTIQFYDSGANLLQSTAGTGVVSNTSTWIQAFVVATAPANTAWARCVITINSTGGASEVHYVDGCQFAVGNAGAALTWVMPGTNSTTTNGLGVAGAGEIGLTVGYTSPNMLTAGQSSFETADGLTSWFVNTNCTLALTSAQAWQGSQSLATTSVASGDSIAQPFGPGGNAFFTVLPSTQYTLLGYARSAASARTIQLIITWYTASQVSISSVTGSATDSTSAWTFISGSGTSPANAAYAQIRWVVKSNGGASEVHYLDGLSFAQGSSTIWHAGGQSGLFLDGATVTITSAGGVNFQNGAGANVLVVSPSGVITTGTFAATSLTGQVPIANGGTNAATATDAANNLLPTQSGSSGKFLQTDGAGALSWASAAGSPGGSNGQVQYDNSGSFGGATKVTVGANGNFILASGSPTSSDGELWYDSGTLALAMNVNGNTEYLQAVIYKQYGNVTVNTTGEQSLTSGANHIGSLTIKANTLKAGSIIRLRAGGIYTSTGTPGTNRINVKLGSTNIASGGSQTSPASQTDRGWTLWADINVHTDGSSGTVWGVGMETRNSSASAASMIPLSAIGSAAITINTTIDNTLDLTTNFGSASQSITLTSLAIEII